MSEPYLLFVVALWAAAVLSTIACASMGRSRLESQQRNLGKDAQGHWLARACMANSELQAGSRWTT